uniref:GRIP1 associated protein 1 n=1 Tax=Scophthalmus maximus TaxID=52904 RepID=A0A8D3BR56_SCOMX
MNIVLVFLMLLMMCVSELNAVRQKNVVLERDFVKAQKEVEALLSENEMLQGKLHSQEEDFRLQNSTLMTELSKLCMQIEQLEKENQGLKEGGGASASTHQPNPTSSPVDGEVLRLQAENSTLQKKMKGVCLLLFPRPRRLCFHPCPFVCLFVCLFVSRIMQKLPNRGSVQRQQVRNTTTTTTSTNTVQRHLVRVVRILLLQLISYVLFFLCRTKIDEINQRKEEELKTTNIRIQKLHSDLMVANQVRPTRSFGSLVASQSAISQEQVDNILQENDALRTNLAALEQIQTVKTQEMNLLREQQEALTSELQQRQAEQESLLAQRDDLDSQLQESSFANRKLLEQLTEEGQEKDRLLRELDEAKKTAEKRKAMLDDMAVQLTQEKSDHKEALSDLKLQHEKEVLGVRARYEKELRGLHEDKNRSEEEIRQQLRDEKARAKELESLQPKVEELQAQVQSMEGTKGWFERRLKEAEVSVGLLMNTWFHHVVFTFSVSLSFCLCVSVLQEKQLEMEGLKQQLVEVEKQREEHGDTIGKLKQLKDLKRQLQLERKRADKLQERLQEILTNSKTRTGLEELVLSEINSPSRTQQTGDSSSVSSFSYRDMMKEPQPTNQNKSGGGSPQSQRPADLSDDEVGELFQRLAEVQQEKWMLEEKVKHLEVSCSSMAEDICRKSAIIETYVMDSRIDVSGGAFAGHGGFQGDRGGLGSVLRDLVKPGDENLREMNKKLQNMLEEQLTKNMHMQKDLEVLSQELVRLSKDNGPGGGAAGSG